MEYTYLGKSGARVSKLALGTMNFGPFTDEKECFQIMDEALEAGINFFDTADMYGAMSPEGYNGWTEEIIGRWFAQGGGRREKVILATKLYWPMNNESYGPNDDVGLSAYKIRRRIEDSLKRLQTDHIDLIQFHRPDRRTSWNEIWDEMERERLEGKITYVGASNFNAYDLAKAQWAADKKNITGLITSQNRYNLLYRKCEGDFLPAVKEMGLGLICWSPLAEGFLAGNYRRQDSGTRRGMSEPIDERNLERLDKYAKLCEEIGHTEAEVSLAWLMQREVVTCPIVGPRTIEHLRKNLKAVDVKLDQKTLEAIDELFPGGKPYIEQGLSWKEID